MTKLLSFYFNTRFWGCFLFIFLINISSLSAQNQQLAHAFGFQQLCCLQHIDRDMRTYVGPPRQLASRANCASFEFTYFGAPPAQAVQDGLQFAADIWSSLLVSQVPIKVNVFYISWQSLGTAIASPIKNFPGAPQGDIWYPYALADAIAGQDLVPGEDDMTIFLDNATNWYFGLDGNVPAGQIDFVSVALHEMGHGLGFTSLSNKRMLEGSFGDIRTADLMLPALPFPPLDSLPGIFDLRLIHGSSGFALTDTNLFANPSQQLGDFFTGGDVFITGSNILAANNNQVAEIYAPAAFAFGSSMTHLDENVYPPGDINSLMSPFIGSAEVEQNPGPITLGLFQDLGWELCDNVSVQDMSFHTISISPNPVRDHMNLHLDKALQSSAQFELYDLHGRLVQTERLAAGSTAYELQVKAKLESGIYLYSFQSEDGLFQGKVWIKNAGD